MIPPERPLDHSAALALDAFKGCRDPSLKSNGPGCCALKGTNWSYRASLTSFNRFLCKDRTLLVS